MSSIRLAMKQSLLSASDRLSGGMNGGTTSNRSRKRRRTKQEARSKEKRRDTHKRTKVACSSTTGRATVPPPSDDILSFLESIPVEEQRQSIAEGHRIKGQIVGVCNRPLGWRGGVVTSVGGGGARIRVKFDDGTCEILDFPDKNVVVDMKGNGQHSVLDGVFRPPFTGSKRKSPLSSSSEDEDEDNSSRAQTGHTRKASSLGPVNHRSQAQLRRESPSKSKPLALPSSSSTDEYEPCASDESELSSTDSSSEEYHSCREDEEESLCEEAEPNRKRISWVEGASENREFAIWQQQQQQMVEVGHRVKVLFGTDTRRNGELSTMQWYFGDVTHVMYGGSKIRIAYDDGDSEICQFPDRDVVLVERESPRQSAGVETRKNPVKPRKIRSPSTKNGKQKSQIRPKACSCSYSEREVQAQRSSIVVGKKLKVLLSTKSKNNGRWRDKWHAGIVARVMAEGSKIFVLFDGEYSATFNYPDDNIVDSEEGNVVRRVSGSSTSSQSLTSSTEWRGERRQSRRPDFYFASPRNDEHTDNKSEYRDGMSNQLTIEEQRAAISEGQKLKVLFLTEVERGGQVIVARKWYSGQVAEVMSRGSKIRIQYNDGTSEVSSYPDKDIVLFGEKVTRSETSESEMADSEGEHNQSNNTVMDFSASENSLHSHVPVTDETSISGESEDTMGGNEQNVGPRSRGTEKQLVLTPVVQKGEVASKEVGSLAHEQRVASQNLVQVEGSSSSSLKLVNDLCPPENVSCPSAQPSMLDRNSVSGKAANSLAQEQRQRMFVGQKIKVRFDKVSYRNGKELKQLTWYSAVVTRVKGGGSKIRVQYTDGTSEDLDFPHEDIVVVHGKYVRNFAMMYHLLVDFKNEHGHCNVAYGKGHDPELAKWVSAQRGLRTKGMLSPDRVGKLESIGFLWNKEGANDARTFQKATERTSVQSRGFSGPSTIIQKEWDVMFERLVKYKEKIGNCHVPARYQGDRELARWVRRQRSLKKEKTTTILSPERVAKLESLGFAWDATFLKGVDSSAARTPDSAVSVEEVVKQKQSTTEEKHTMEDMSPSKVIALGPARMTGTNQEIMTEDTYWSEMFERLKKFRETYGHCFVVQRYKKDPQLGKWVNSQRTLKKKNRLSSQQVELLDSIDFAWDGTSWRSIDYRRSMTGSHATATEASLAKSPPRHNVAAARVSSSNGAVHDPWQDDAEYSSAFTPEEDELILNIVLGKEMPSSASIDIGEKMRLLANYSPDELYQRAMELQQVDQAPAVGSVGYCVTTALQAKKDVPALYGANRAMRIR